MTDPVKAEPDRVAPAANPAIVAHAFRSPLPATVDIDEANDACFIVKDHNGHAPAYVYFEKEPPRMAGDRATVKPQDESSTVCVPE